MPCGRRTGRKKLGVTSRSTSSFLRKRLAQQPLGLWDWHIGTALLTALRCLLYSKPENIAENTIKTEQKAGRPRFPLNGNTGRLPTSQSSGVVGDLTARYPTGCPPSETCPKPKHHHHVLRRRGCATPNSLRAFFSDWLPAVPAFVLRINIDTLGIGRLTWTHTHRLAPTGTSRRVVYGCGCFPDVRFVPSFCQPKRGVTRGASSYRHAWPSHCSRYAPHIPAAVASWATPGSSRLWQILPN
ncbi:hypothetical protein QBC36DRAFT_10583 [Triangularia setosa]|uniref:Uncharacterized protein n=1 Tax=Triangularia setosa TaxID=2587417 RepID=A0AAN6WEU5_9PEZI|nr:hypothetical protein QBC36DRAFT_10583 [Podospora setosa]